MAASLRIEADIIAGAQRGDNAAIEAIIAQYSDRLYRYFYRATGSRHDAEDLLQDLWVRLVVAMRVYRHDGRFEAWLFRLAGNLAKNHARDTAQATQMGVATEDEQGDRFSQLPAHGESDPATLIEQAEQIDQLRQALAELPEAQREVLTLHYFEQLTFEQIAERLDIQPGTAKMRAHRGMKRLRALMGADNMDGDDGGV